MYKQNVIWLNNYNLLQRATWKDHKLEYTRNVNLGQHQPTINTRVTKRQALKVVYTYLGYPSIFQNTSDTYYEQLYKNTGLYQSETPKDKIYNHLYFESNVRWTHIYNISSSHLGKKHNIY